jgi:[acyl-carrier-protein] S-malonyltransferase
MGTDLRQASAAARRVFDLADDITGLPIARLCAEGSLERLTETDVAQPAVMATSLAALEVLRAELRIEPNAVAGHSLGEYPAYVAAGVFDAEAGLNLVHKRAQAMAAACAGVDGGMAAIIGLDEATLQAECQVASVDGSSVVLANLNAPGQLIVAGARDALERLAAGARAAGARRVLPLNVGGPFHSVYMRPAADALARAIAESEFSPAAIPVVANASARPLQQPEELRQELAMQLYSPVRWMDTLQCLARLGCDRFLEVGPGQVLAGLVRRTLADVKVASFGTLADLPAARALVGG